MYLEGQWVRTPANVDKLKHLRVVFLDAKRHYDPLLAPSFLKMKLAKNCIRLQEAGEP